MKNGKGKIILLLIISILSIKKVNAETCTLGNEYTNELASVLNSQFSANIGNNAWSVNFNTPIQLNGAEMQYVKFYLHYSIRQTRNTITNINLTETCEGVSTNSNFSNPSYTITYADGTQANVSGIEYDSICSSYNISGGSANYTYQPNINMVHLVIIRDDDRYIPCDVDSNGIAKCPIEGNHSYKAFRYYMTLSEGTNVPITIGIITRNVPKCSNDSQAIINNNKQNAQDIKDGINNADYNGTTEQPDSTEFNSYEQKEQALENMTNADMSKVNVGLNANASNWIWTIINRILNANSIIMSFYITILSIGVIKLIMRR